MPAKRPASFLLTPQYRVDVLWLTGAGPEVKTEAPPAAEPPNEPPAPFVDLHGLEGLLHKPDPKIVLSLPEDAELIDQLHKLTGKNAKVRAIYPTTARHRNPSSRHPSTLPPRRPKRQPAEETKVPNAPTMDLCDLTSGRRRKHAAAE